MIEPHLQAVDAGAVDVCPYVIQRPDDHVSSVLQRADEVSAKQHEPDHNQHKADEPHRDVQNGRNALHRARI